MKLHLRDRVVELAVPLLMGIVNVTPDSFSDGGKFFSAEDAFAQARRLAEEGADIVDIGGESTRPGAKKIGLQEEIDRVLPVVGRVKREIDVLVSIDTTQAEVARQAVEEGGADLINDISALSFSPEMATTVFRLQVPVVLMHIQGTPENMQQDPHYDDVVQEVSDFFSERVAFAEATGIRRDRIFLDPGIGFGKRLEDNIALIRGLGRLRKLGYPLLIGVSRKSFLGKISGQNVPEKRQAETIAATLVATLNGAAIVRVHEVQPMVMAIRVARALADFPAAP